MGTANFSQDSPKHLDDPTFPSLENFFSTDQTNLGKIRDNYVTLPDGQEGMANRRMHPQAEAMNLLMNDYQGRAHSIYPIGILISVLLADPDYLEGIMLYHTVKEVRIEEDAPKEIKWTPDIIWLARYSEAHENPLLNLTAFLESLGLKKAFIFSLSKNGQQPIIVHKRTQKIEMPLPKTKEDLMKLLESVGSLLNIDLISALQQFLK